MLQPVVTDFIAKYEVCYFTLFAAFHYVDVENNLKRWEDYRWQTEKKTSLTLIDIIQNLNDD